jgi:hypothetical protein
MATNTYKCTVCKRQVERLENIYGLDILAKCVITSGCLGKLRKIGRNLDNIRESFPKFESNLTDYTPRNAFAQYRQDIASNRWMATHGLNCSPSVAVFTETDGVWIQSRIGTYEVKTKDSNSVEIVFPSKTSGIVQFTARSSSTIPKVPIPSNPSKVTVGGSFVFAIPKYITKDANGNSITLDLRYPVSDIRI